MVCSKCGAQLSPVFSDLPRRRRNDFPQYEDSLVITIEGGFGMFYDGPSVRGVYCGTCAKLVIKELGIRLSEF